MRKPPHRRQLAQRHPVAAAVAVADMRSVLRSQQINVYQAADGEEATEALSLIGWQLAMGLQTLALAQPKDSPLLRRLHTALRNVQQMCLDGYQWRSALAPMIDNALTDAMDVLVKHSSTALAAIPLADHFRDLVQQHKVEPDTIHGAELYQQLAPEAP